ncbi:GIY-YIG nuclease family protein [Patescibacteria group bacterium]|nr:GIY-YIG nuclease family protein [Patescibacteria group bacterium]
MSITESVKIKKELKNEEKLNSLNKLKKKANLAPKKAGVYFWLGKNKEILYIGRATSLNSRLKQYFQKNIEPRIAEMVENSINLRFEETETLLEAIILEAKYIKKYWPKYNVRDRDDRSFIYLALGKTDFAKPLIIRGRDLGKFNSKEVDIFGPYQSFYLLQSALRLIRRIFPYSLCQVGSGNACFDYQIGLCPGACVNKISAKDYGKNIENIKLLLSGNKKLLIKKLIKDNPAQLKAFKQLQDVSLLGRESDLKETQIFRLEAYDISHHSGKESYGSMVVFENGEANKKEYRLFKIKEAPEADDERALLEVLSRRLKHEEWARPDLILIDGGSPQISFLTKALKQKNINLTFIGLSKYAGDKIIFSSDIKKEKRLLIENLKPVLLKARGEAHRFANFGRKRAFKGKDFK